MSALRSLRLSRLRLGGRRPRWLTTWRALVALAAVVAVVLTVGPSHGAPPGPASATAATGYVAGQHGGLHIPAMAAVAVSGEQTSTRSIGAGDEQPFVIGSVTKSFTAMATMQLVESGKVRLDGPVVSYRSASDRITVRQLLSHTSGLTTEEGEIGFRHPATTLEREVRDPASVRAEPPGTFRYSNANFEVLGELIAAVSGTS